MFPKWGTYIKNIIVIIIIEVYRLLTITLKFVPKIFDNI